jgi:hypothetical protein
VKSLVLFPSLPPLAGPAARRLQLADVRASAAAHGAQGRWQQGDRSRSPEAITYQSTTQPGCDLPVRRKTTKERFQEAEELKR